MAKKEKKVTNKENNNKDNKNKKSFFKGLKAELKKVIWPTPKQLVNNTIAVITIVLMTTLIVFVLDLAFESLNKYGIDKLLRTESEFYGRIIGSLYFHVVRCEVAHTVIACHKQISRTEFRNVMYMI